MLVYNRISKIYKTKTPSYLETYFKNAYEYFYYTFFFMYLIHIFSNCSFLLCTLFVFVFIYHVFLTRLVFAIPSFNDRPQSALVDIFQWPTRRLTQRPLIGRGEMLYDLKFWHVNIKNVIVYKFYIIWLTVV